MKYPVFSPLSSKIASTEWGIPREQCADIQTVMNQPYRVAAVLVKCTMPENFAYDTAYENVDFSKFDAEFPLSDVRNIPPPSVLYSPGVDVAVFELKPFSPIARD